MGFSEFLGNERIVASLRGMLKSERVPSAMLFLGPRGVGRFTLARMFAQAANCERMRDDFCGECDTCRRISLLGDPAALIEQGLTERGESPDSATVERVPLILQTHPDVWAVVPDPVRAKMPVARPVIHIGQLRAIQRAAQFRPHARRRIFILDGAETMRWDLASVFLKILEEPPETSTLILLAPSPYQLLPTIVSRCMQFYFAPATPEEMERILRERTKLALAQRKLAAELADGSPGVALGMDFDEANAVRHAALKLLELAASGKPGALFAHTNALTKQKAVPFDALLEAGYSLLADLLELANRPSEPDLRNPSMKRELAALSARADSDWVARAVRGLDIISGRQRRNINRQLALDALGLSLARS
jgi:DNA polymerase III subunit delta'